MPTFGDFERRMLSYFTQGTEFVYRGELFVVLEADKPTCFHGEPKTDIYILAEGNSGKKEIKISYKKENADFLENKTTAERAGHLFGTGWREIIKKSTMEIQELFEQRIRIYKNSYRRTEKGAITLGWKFELLRRPGGNLSGIMELSDQQVYDVYSETNLPQDKQDALINGRIVEKSGVADYILISNNVLSAQDVIDQMIPIEEYIKLHPSIYFACKALNYRTFRSKYDGNRPLAVQVDWKIKDGKLCSELIFDKPLELNGKEMADRLLRCFAVLGIETTDDINENNADMHNVY